MRLITLLLLCLALAGCAAYDAVTEGVSGISDYFLGGEDNSDPPALLVEYTPQSALAKYWLQIGKVWLRPGI